MNMLEGRIAGGRFVSSHGFSIAVPTPSRRVEEAEPVTLGLRPTDLALGHAREGEAAIKGGVSRIEYGGADIYIDLELAGAERLRMRAPPETAIASGETIEARIATKALHLFAADGRSLKA
jgi:ABC-type sugar transport system ATPase subunit